MSAREPPLPSLSEVLSRADRLIDWYAANRPTVKRLAVTARDWKVLSRRVDADSPLTMGEGGVLYRDFLLYYPQLPP
jgi:hypothetical protein